MFSGLPLSDCEFVAVDLETTGCSPGRHSIIEVGAVRLRGGEVVDSFEHLVRPSDSLPRAITQLTGITHEMVATAPAIDEVMAAFRSFAAGAVLVAHNYRFDLGFLDYEAERLWGEPFPRPALDTLSLARRIYPSLERYSLLYLAEHFGATTRPDHRAANDARAAGEVLLAMLPALIADGMETVGDLAAYSGLTDQQALASRLPLTIGVPDSPGVYIFRDAEDRVLYVGRARNLRQRVRSHFYPGADRSRSDLGCVVAAIRAIPASSGLDSALLERHLLARHDPPFNATSQRPHSVYFLHVDTYSAYPGVRVVTVKRLRGVHIGPFTSRWAARMMADRLAEIYGLRRCSRRLNAVTAERDCDRRDTTCPSPCVNDTDRVAYGEAVSRFLAVFDGGEDGARALLAARQEEAASEARYEDAIRYRDGLRALDRAMGTLHILRTASVRDVVIIEHTDEGMTLHLVRGGLRMAVLRGLPSVLAERLPRALHRVYFSGRPRPDLLDMTAAQVAELLTISTFLAGDGHAEVPIADERLALAALNRALGLGRRQPRRRHAAI